MIVRLVVSSPLRQHTTSRMATSPFPPGWLPSCQPIWLHKSTVERQTTCWKWNKTPLKSPWKDGRTQKIKQIPPTCIICSLECTMNNMLRTGSSGSCGSSPFFRKPFNSDRNFRLTLGPSMDTWSIFFRFKLCAVNEPNRSPDYLCPIIADVKIASGNLIGSITPELNVDIYLTLLSQMIQQRKHTSWRRKPADPERMDTGQM